MPSTNLIIRHVTGSTPHQFQLHRPLDDCSTPAVVIPSPWLAPIEGADNSRLESELRWYLEEFLQYPLPPHTLRAERVLAALRNWGESAFHALFRHRDVSLFEAGSADDYGALELCVSSDDPHVLAWPWEALHDESGDALALKCRLERHVGQQVTWTVAWDLPTDRVNVLLVTARPYQGDVRFRSISHALVSSIREHSLPSRVDLLRPPTFAQLQNQLRTKSNHYHIIHFDGHGYYGPQPLVGVKGCLVFEDERGKPHHVSGAELGDLLCEHHVPIAVLNACRSGMLDQRADERFSSVAMSLVEKGVKSVVAMSYSLYVKGAQQYFTAFYDKLFRTGNLAEAVHAGRVRMHANSDRVCPRGVFKLQDWLCPVLYQQAGLRLDFVAKTEVEPRPQANEDQTRSGLPPSVQQALDHEPCRFVGRDASILDLERALRDECPAVLIQGLGGVGKTTLARRFLQWLDDTGGLEGPVFWFGFAEDDIRSAERVFDRLGDAIFGDRFRALGPAEKVRRLASVLRRQPLLVVWDNFEIVAGNVATPATFSETERHRLKRFLAAIHGGRTKVLITSRSPELWLENECRPVALSGFDGEERWEYLQLIMSQLGTAIRSFDRRTLEFIDRLQGHPLAMRVTAPYLADCDAADLSATLRSYLATLKDQESIDPAHRQLFAAMRFLHHGLPSEWQDLLSPLSLHESFVELRLFEVVTKQVSKQWRSSDLVRFAAALVKAGLLRHRGETVYEMHPVLTEYLRSQLSPDEAWQLAFINATAQLADVFAPLELNQQQNVLYIQGANFRHACRLAESRQMHEHCAAITQCLGSFAINERNLPVAKVMFQNLAKHQQNRGKEREVAMAYHQLGLVTELQRDFDRALACYQKSCEIKERLGNQQGLANTYHQMGTVAERKHELEQARRWYQESIKIKQALNDEQGVAGTSLHLGTVAQKLKDLTAAERYYQECLRLARNLGREDLTSSAYHQLGRLAEQQQDWDVARRWYEDSLDISRKRGDEHAAGIALHQLGLVAEEQEEYDEALEWYYQSLEIKERIGETHGAAMTYGQLGIVRYLQGRYEDAAQWLVRSIQGFSNVLDHNEQQRNVENFVVFYQHAPSDQQPRMRKIWEDTQLGELDEALHRYSPREGSGGQVSN